MTTIMESMHIDEEKKRLQVAMAELAHSLSQIAEAMGYPNHRERDPQRNIRQALDHMDCARANLKSVAA